MTSDALETPALRISGKRSLQLTGASEARLQGVDYDNLIERVDEQHAPHRGTAFEIGALCFVSACVV